MKFFAHSTDNPDKSDWQTLASHLTAVGELAAKKASVFGSGEYARVAGLLHDLGKYTREFQNRLAGDGARVDHSTWGARIACERYGAIGQLLAYGIAGHHAGLANGRCSGKRRALSDRLRGQLPTLLPDWQQEIELPTAASLGQPIGFQPLKGRAQFQLSLLARMIFSCLVDADFLDTEAFYRRQRAEKNWRGGKSTDLADLRANLNKYLASFKPDSNVNRLRAEILTEVRKKAELSPGLFSLTVPTGGGKTLASMAFGLDHAIKYGLQRVIYVIPFTSIVEQSAGIFRQAFGELGDEAVLEHHSAFIDDEKRSPEAREKLKLAMENWDASVVVTTAVQFFESLFADRPSKCRKLHNIAGSVIVLDEAQVLPLKLLRPCVAVLDELALNYRCTIVVCTATQPALNEPNFKGGLDNVRELAPEPKRLLQAFQRVRIKHVGPMDDNALMDHLVKRKQILCIVNNRRHARALHQAMAGLPGAYHLTTLMCAKHRSHVLSEVKQRLRDGEDCRLVATSLVEAGVDVDFPAVLRAEAGLDSIAQAAGRCNREGKRPVESSEVLIFLTDNDEWVPPPELKQFAQVAREVLRHHPEEPLSLVAIEKYFCLLYWQKGPQELDAHDLLGRFEESNLDRLPFETVAAKFRMIESVQHPVIIPFDAAARKALGDLEFVESCGGIARRLQPYVVQLPRQGYEALRKAGAIQPIAEKKFGEQFIALINESLYNNHVGLTWNDPVLIEAEQSVI